MPLRQRHLELDLRQLLRRLADLAQERQPAWVGVDLVEQVIRHDLGEAGVAVLDRLVEPRERLISLAAVGVDVGDVVGRVLLVLRDQRGERGVRVGLAPERVVGHRQADHLPDLARLLLDLRQRALRIALQQQRVAELGVRAAPARGEAQHGAERRDRRVEPAGQALVEAEVGERCHVDRIAADEGLVERQRLVQAAERLEQRGAVAQHVQVRRIERQRAIEVLRRTGEIVVAIHRDTAEPGVGRRVLRIDRERLHRRLAGLGIPLLVGQQAHARLVGEVAGQPVPRRGVARIDRQYLAVQRVGLLERLGGVLPSELHGLQVKRVRLGIGRARLRRRAEQRDLELLDHVRRDLVLDREDVVELAVVGLRPQVRVGAGLDQLRRDPHRVAGLAHRAFQHMRHVQRARDLRNRDLLALE